MTTKRNQATTMKMRVQPAGSGERGSAMVLVLLMMVLFFALGMAILTSAQVEGSVGTNDEWFEGALYAAEAGIQAGIDQAGSDIGASTAAIALTDLSNRYSFRSGTRTDTVAQPLSYQGSSTAAGYSLGSGTGYNPSGYLFLQYQANATGIAPRNITRELESRIQYGPVAN